MWNRALGTDTGGSVRLPAAYTGTVGFKPSYGLLSRWGVVAYANSLDTVGILGKDISSVRDTFGTSLLFGGVVVECRCWNANCFEDVLNVYDPRDPTSLSSTSRSRILSYLQKPYLSSRMTSLPLRIGVPIEYNIKELSPSVRRAWVLSLAHLKREGHIIEPVSLPATKSALSAYYVLAPAEASSNLARYDGVRYGVRHESHENECAENPYSYAKTRGEGFGSEVKRRILLGTFSLSAGSFENYFIQAQRIRRLMQRDFNTAFKMDNLMASRSEIEAGESLGHADIDIIVCPTSPSPPPRLSSVKGVKDVQSPLDAYTADVFTVPASLAGLPAVSVPVSVPGPGESELASIQLIGQYGDDDLVLKAGELLQGRTLGE